jgi:hypothetical protein
LNVVAWWRASLPARFAAFFTDSLRQAGTPATTSDPLTKLTPHRAFQRPSDDIFLADLIDVEPLHLAADPGPTQGVFGNSTLQGRRSPACLRDYHLR